MLYAVHQNQGTNFMHTIKILKATFNIFTISKKCTLSFSVCVRMCVHTHPWRLEDGVRAPGAGVTGVGRCLTWVLGVEFRSPAIAVLLTAGPYSPHLQYLKILM